MTGILAEHVDNRFNLTSDQTVLDVVSGYKIPFVHPPFHLAFPNVLRLSPRDHLDCIDEINKLLDKRIISSCTPTENQFISSFFLVDKPNGTKRFILNLKALNKFIIAPHFKLEDLKTVLRLVSKSCWMATIDLQDSYFTIKIDKNYKKFLRFKFEDTLYEFNCLPFGLCLLNLNLNRKSFFESLNHPKIQNKMFRYSFQVNVFKNTKERKVIS